MVLCSLKYLCTKTPTQAYRKVIIQRSAVIAQEGSSSIGSL